MDSTFTRAFRLSLTNIQNSYIKWIILFGVLITLSIAQLNNKLFFHTSVEILSVLLGYTILLLVFSIPQVAAKPFFRLTAYGYFWVSNLDLLHALTFEGMGIFQNGTTNVSVQFWIVARFLETLTLLGGGFLLYSQQFTKKQIDQVFWLFFAIFGLGSVSIYFFSFFPTVFIPGSGLTSFKIGTELLLCAVLVFTIEFYRRADDKSIKKNIIIAICFTIAAELLFTLYHGPKAFAVQAGHFLKLVSIYFIYQALVQEGILNKINSLTKIAEASENKLDKLISEAGDMIFSTDKEGNILDVNYKVTSSTKLETPQILGQSIFSFLNLSSEQQNSFMNSSHLNTPIKTQFATNSGNISVSLNLIENRTEDLETQFYFILRDITSQVLAENHTHILLARQKVINRILNKTLEEAPLNKLFEDILDIFTHSHLPQFLPQASIYLVDEEEKYLKLACCRFTSEFQQPECDGVELENCLCPNTTDPTQIINQCCTMDKTFLNEGDTVSHEHCCIPCQLNDELLGVFKLHVKKGHSFDSDEKLFLKSISDAITMLLMRKRHQSDKEDMQAQFSHTAKLATVGTLASNIAHDISNPLTMLLGYSRQLFKVKQNFKEEEQTKIELIDQYARRIKEISQNLITTVRTKTELKKEQIHLNDSIKKSLLLIERSIQQRGIELEIDLSDHLPRIWGYPGQVESIMQNLLSNAIDAIMEKESPDKKIIIKTSANLEDETLELLFIDNGIGMSDETLSRLYIPFFTTKPEGKGTGLGMGIIIEILKSMKGTIQTESELNQGTQFIISFPISKESSNEKSEHA